MAEATCPPGSPNGTGGSAAGNMWGVAEIAIVSGSVDSGEPGSGWFGAGLTCSKTTATSVASKASINMAITIP